MLAMFLAALDMTIVGTAMPSIIAALHGVSIYSWVFSVYLLTSTVPVPIFGKLADLYGRKRLFMVGIVLFTLGSFLAGLSVNMPELILFRALQGLGAAGVLPIALTIIGDGFSLEQRAKIQGFFSAVWGISAVLGPLLGAVIVQYSNWRYVFEVNVPIGFLVLLVLGLTFHEQVKPRAHQIDWLGTVLLIVGVTSLLVYLIQNPSRFASPTSLGILALTIVSLIGFALWEKRVPEPILPTTIFKHRMILVANATSFFAGAVVFGLISYLPLYVQGVLGGSPTAAGQAITPMMIGWPISAFLAAPLILRWGYRMIGIWGGSMIAAGSVLYVAVGSLGWVVGDISLLIIGMGMGMSVTGLLMASQNAVDWRERGAVTASNQFFRTIGGSVGVAVLGAVMNTRMTQLVQGSIYANKVHISRITEQLLAANTRSTMSPVLRQAFVGMMGQALQWVFWGSAIFAILVFMLVLLIPAGTAEEHAAAVTSSSEGV